MEAVKDKVGNLDVVTEIVPDKRQAWKEKEHKKEMRRRKVLRLKLFMTAVVFTVVLRLVGCSTWVSMIPFFLHFVLLFYGFANAFYKERYWKRYLKKYADSSGNIPPHVRSTHLKLIKQGKKIKV